MKKDILTFSDISIKDALKKLDNTAEKVIIVVNENSTLLGALSDGDIRRALLSGKNLEDTIEGIYNPKPCYIKKTDSDLKRIQALFLQNKIELIPIVDDAYKVIDFITWEQAFTETRDQLKTQKPVDVPIVIMAGGKGTRLEPFTKVLPKPLIPIGEKTILEIIIDRFSKFGINKYYFTLNFKGEMIKAYFKSIDHNLDIKYVFEPEFLGTAGSLKLVENDISDTFIVSNCDIIVNADYEDVVNFHRKNDADLTVLSAIHHYQIPYGVVSFEKNGRITEILEKPERTLTINTGVYIINKNCLDLIPQNQFFHMTDLINIMLEKNMNVLTYPVNENDYIDIGQWEEYRKAIDFFK